MNPKQLQWLKELREAYGSKGIAKPADASTSRPPRGQSVPKASAWGAPALRCSGNWRGAKLPGGSSDAACSGDHPAAAAPSAGQTKKHAPGICAQSCAKQEDNHDTANRAMTSSFEFEVFSARQRSAVQPGTEKGETSEKGQRRASIDTEVSVSERQQWGATHVCQRWASSGRCVRRHACPYEHPVELQSTPSVIEAPTSEKFVVLPRAD